MAKYKKRKDGRYAANIVVGYDEVTGERVYAPTIYAYSIAELERKKAEVITALDKGTYAYDYGYSVGEYADTWFNTYRMNSGIKTKEMYHRLVYTHIIPALGEFRLKDLKKSDVQRMINDRSDHPRTCQQIKMCMNQILESAIDDGLLFKNVCRNITLPTYRKPEKRSLNEIEMSALKRIDGKLSRKEKAFVYIIQYCGLRPGEALALSIGDIDFAENFIHVRNNCVFSGNASSLKYYPKTSAGIRSVPMPTVLHNYLKAYISTLSGLFLFEMGRKSGLMTKSSFRRFWLNIVDSMNESVGGTKDLRIINGLTPYSFRHNYATMLYYAGVEVLEAKVLMGHEDISITYNIYTHLDKKKTKAGSKLDSYLDKLSSAN